MVHEWMTTRFKRPIISFTLTTAYNSKLKGGDLMTLMIWFGYFGDDTPDNMLTETLVVPYTTKKGLRRSFYRKPKHKS